MKKLETLDDRQALRSLRNKLQKHFRDDMGFHFRFNKNEPPIVYFPKYGGAHVESALNNWGIQTTHLIHNVTQRLYAAFHHEPEILWPCDIHEIREDKTPNDIHNLVALLADPKSDIVNGRVVVKEYLQSVVRFLSEGLMHLMTGK